jgi:hypothetical protein
MAGVALLLLAAGCGSGDSSATATGAETTVEAGSLSKGEFIKEANAICQQAQTQGIAELKAYTAENNISDPDKLSDQQAGEVLSTVITPIYHEEIEEIGALGAPAADVKKVEAILKEMDTGLQKAKKDPFESLREDVILGEASELAATYGMSVCSASWG